MLPGPDKVLACSECNEPVRVRTLLSGNTFGAVGWTDGKAEFPMLPMEPVIARCPGCGHLYWLAEATELGYLAWMDEAPEMAPESWRTAPYVEELSESGYLEALAAGASQDKDREILLRIRAWWAGNDPLRKKGKVRDRSARPLSEAARVNLERLLAELRAERADQILMKAEILRELERFDEAKEMLACELPEDLQGPARQIRRLADKGNARVQRILNN